MQQQPNCTIIIRLEYFPLAFIYAMLTPTLEVNGYKEKRDWGMHTLYVAPGRYLVAASYPWIFTNECGKNYVDFVIHPGETKIVTYTAPMMRYFPGKIVVQ